MLSRWSIGKWRINGDTLLLRVIPVYDTLKMTNVKHELADTLILSDDETSERVEIEQMIKTGISARVQTITDYPSMLIYRKGRFYKIRKGRLVTKKEKGFWSKKKWSPWYFKSDE